MPYHKIPRASQDDAIALIEREGEIIVQVCPIPDDPDHVDVYTRWPGQVLEVRA